MVIVVASRLRTQNIFTVISSLSVLNYRECRTIQSQFMKGQLNILFKHTFLGSLDLKIGISGETQREFVTLN